MGECNSKLVNRTSNSSAGGTIAKCEDEEEVINKESAKSVGKIAHRIQMSWYKNT